MTVERETDVARLRKNMADYYTAGAFAAVPAMITEAWAIEEMSPEEVAEKAERDGFDLSSYTD